MLRGTIVIFVVIVVIVVIVVVVVIDDAKIKSDLLTHLMSDKVTYWPGQLKNDTLGEAMMTMLKIHHFNAALVIWAYFGSVWLLRWLVGECASFARKICKVVFHSFTT